MVGSIYLFSLSFFFFSADAIEVPLAHLHFGTQFGYILTIIALRLTAFTVL